MALCGYQNNNKMAYRIPQQNKQAEEAKKIALDQFFSMKTVFHHKKIVVKKSMKVPFSYSRLPADEQACKFARELESRSQKCTSYSLGKPRKIVPNSSTNVINIMFQRSGLLSGKEHKVYKKSGSTEESRKTYLSHKNRHTNCITKNSNPPNQGLIQNSLTIQPFQKPYRRKQFFMNSHMVSRRAYKKNSRTVVSNQMFLTDMNKQIADVQDKQKNTKTALNFATKGQKIYKINKKMQQDSTAYQFDSEHCRQYLQEGATSERDKLRASERESQRHFNQFEACKNSLEANVWRAEQAAKVKGKGETQAYVCKSEMQVTALELDSCSNKQITALQQKQLRQMFPIRKPMNRKDYFVFGMSEKSNEPENKIQLYRDYLWKINYSNGLYVHTPEKQAITYRAYFGHGNNSCMLKSIMRRRFWWNIVEGTAGVEGCHFVWTQLKMNSIFKTQSNKEQENADEHEEERLQQTEQSQKQQRKMQFKQQYLTYKESKIQNPGEEQSPEQSLIAHSKIFNEEDFRNWHRHYLTHKKTEQKIGEQTYIKRYNLYLKKSIQKIEDSSKLKVHNHLQCNYYIGNKKALLYNIKRYCECRQENPFESVMPITFHIAKGVDDPVYEEFVTYFKKMEELKRIDKDFRNIWIAKPGENTNRGNGISVCRGLDDVKHRLRGRERNSDGKPRTFILQKYIEKPLLYKNRKFDIRHYMLITCFNGKVKAYWYDSGYVRTSSSHFDLKNIRDVYVHLTNDAVQKKCETYGKHEKGNKISYEDFQKYLDSVFRKRKIDFFGRILRKMKKLALTAMEATYAMLDPNRKQHNFQLIGLDFMIDQNFKPWLIEANTNPCLELSCPLLEKMIPNMIEQTFRYSWRYLRLCVDPFFPPPENWNNPKKQFFGENTLREGKYELIFDECVDGEAVQQILQREATPEKYSGVLDKIEEDNEIFENDGDEMWEQKT